MEAFEKFVGQHLKKSFPYCQNINNVENLGDWMICTKNRSLYVIECKNWVDGYSRSDHKTSQPKQFKTLSKIPAFILATIGGSFRNIELIYTIDGRMKVRGPISWTIKILKAYDEHGKFEI